MSKHLVSVSVDNVYDLRSVRIPPEPGGKWDRESICKNCDRYPCGDDSDYIRKQCSGYKEKEK